MRPIEPYFHRKSYNFNNRSYLLASKTCLLSIKKIYYYILLCLFIIMIITRAIDPNMLND